MFASTKHVCRKKPVRSPEQLAAAAAKRKNERAVAAAPLLAWGGLVEQVTPDEMLEQRIKVQTDAYWRAEEIVQGHAQMHAEADWLRWVVWSLVDASTYNETCEWADHVRGPAYCRLSAWREACDRVMKEGHHPLPEAATMTPSACWPSYARAIAEGNEAYKRERERHSGCTLQRCEVAQIDRPSPFRMTPRGFVSASGAKIDDWIRMGGNP